MDDEGKKLLARMASAMEDVSAYLSKQQRRDVPDFAHLELNTKKQRDEFRNQITAWIHLTQNLPWSLVFKFLVAFRASEAFIKLKAQHEYWQLRVKFEFPPDYINTYNITSKFKMNKNMLEYVMSRYAQGDSPFATFPDRTQPLTASISPWFLLYQGLNLQVAALKINAVVSTNMLDIRFGKIATSLPWPLFAVQTDLNQRNVLFLDDTFKFVDPMHKPKNADRICRAPNCLFWVSGTTSRLHYKGIHLLPDIQIRFNNISHEEYKRAGELFTSQVNNAAVRLLGIDYDEEPKAELAALPNDFLRFILKLSPELKVYPLNKNDTVCRTGFYQRDLGKFVFVDGKEITLDLPSHLKLWDVFWNEPPFPPLVLVSEYSTIYDYYNSKFMCGQYNYYGGWLTFEHNNKWSAINLRRYLEYRALGDRSSYQPIQLTPPKEVTNTASAMVVFGFSITFVFWETLDTKKTYISRIRSPSSKLIGCDVCHLPCEQKCQNCDQRICSSECTALALDCLQSF